MALINRALKVRIYPTQEQEVLINKTLGCSRFLYNQMLNDRIQIYDRLKNNKKELYTYKYKTEKEYKAEFEWLKEVDAKSLQQANIDLSNAYSNFFKSLKGERKGTKVGFPKFKKKGHNDSYRTVQAIKVNFNDNLLIIPKLKLKFRHKGIKNWYLTSKPKSVTISKVPSGKYYASILFEGEQDFNGSAEIINNSKILGLDMSMDKFYVDQYGNSPNYQKLYRINEKKLAKFQKELSRKTRGSKNWEKARVKVAKLHEKIANQRKDFIDKLSLKLVTENDVIIIENLSLKGMSQALNLGKSVMDIGYSSFVNKLMYKSLWNDKIVIKADKWFASSKTCSCCGYIKKNLLLQERNWKCPNCGTEHNRDQNAGQNLVQFGLKYLGQEMPKVKLVEKISSDLNKSLDQEISVKQEYRKIDENQLSI